MGQLALLKGLHQYTTARCESVRAALRQVQEALNEAAPLEEIQRSLHWFLREAWDTLNGLAREINLCMHARFPEAGLHPPLAMTRQCGLYTVRRILHEHPSTASHLLSQRLWEATKTAAEAPYRRLSFLNNVSLFLPVPLPGGKLLPGTNDLTAWAEGLIKPEQVDRQPIAEALKEIADWLTEFSEEFYGLMRQALEEAPSNHKDET